MPTRKVMVSPTTTSIASYVKKNAMHVKTSQKHTHQKNESVRQADHKGHHILVRTQYEIEVDEHMVRGHMGVTNDGHVHYHPLPNLSFTSAVDLVKQLIDTFPDDFSTKGTGSMGGMKMKQTKPKKGHTQH